MRSHPVELVLVPRPLLTDGQRAAVDGYAPRYTRSPSIRLHPRWWRSFDDEAIAFLATGKLYDGDWRNTVTGVVVGTRRGVLS